MKAGDRTRTPVASATLGLRESARVREIDRQILNIRIRRIGLQWVILPAFAVSIGVVSLSVLGTGPVPIAGAVTAAVGVVTAGLAAVRFWDDSRQEISDLRAERGELAEEPPSTRASLAETILR